MAVPPKDIVNDNVKGYSPVDPLDRGDVPRPQRLVAMLPLLLLAFAGYGIYRGRRDPSAVLPFALGEPTPAKVWAVYGSLAAVAVLVALPELAVILGSLGCLVGLVAAVVALVSKGSPKRALVLTGVSLAALTAGGIATGADGAAPEASEAGAYTADADPATAVQDAVADAAEDSIRVAEFAALDSLLQAGDYAQTQDRARALVLTPAFSAVGDSLDRVADRAEEGAMYERASAMPGSDLQGNRDAYAELAERFPSSERYAVYVEKRDSYTQRVIDQESRRYRAYAPARQPAGRNCCKRCSAGKPCGDSCISRSKSCNKGPGCAC